MIIVAVFAGVLAPYDPVAVDFGAMLARPSAQHWLGTDAFGRDVMSRLIYGSRTALFVGFGAAFVGATAGAILGVGSAYFGGRMDLYLQRLMDIFLSFPLIILALAIVAILGNALHNVIMAITIPMIPRCALVIRSSALSIRRCPTWTRRGRRASGMRGIILRHMLPNVMASYLILLTAFLGQAILLEASLSFLGLGVQEPIAAWGLMLRGPPSSSPIRPLDGDLPRSGDQPRRLRLQPVRRFPPRRARPQAAHALGGPESLDTPGWG